MGPLLRAVTAALAALLLAPSLALADLPLPGGVLGEGSPVPLPAPPPGVLPPLPRPGVEARFLGLDEGALLEPGASVGVRLRVAGDLPVAPPVVFTFTPDGAAAGVVAGVAWQPEETAGPDCEGPCRSREVFRATLGAVWPVETWGHLGVRVAGQTADAVQVRVLWDPTPPRATILLPSFAAPAAGVGAATAVAATLDEDVVRLRVWQAPTLACAGLRALPHLDQNDVGAALSPGGGASCVPTAMGANFRWADDVAGYADLVGTGASDVALVTELGQDMRTGADGTTYSETLHGIQEYLARNVPGPPGYVVDAAYGPITVEQVVEANARRGVVLLGIFKKDPPPCPPPGTPPDQPVGCPFVPPAMGHAVALRGLCLNPDGSATLYLMDPQDGAYKARTMLPNGDLLWQGSSPDTQVVEVRWLVNPWFFTLGGIGQGYDRFVLVDDVQGSGLRAWSKTFPVAPGPFLLLTEATDASGRVQYDWQFVPRGPGA